MTAFDQEAGTIASFLARSGVDNPETSKPWTDAMIFGLGGGIGFMCFVFTYQGHAPIASFVTRFHTKSGGYTGFADGALGRSGATVAVTRSSSSAQADKQLRASLDAGKSVLLWVDGSALPPGSAPNTLTGTSPALVVAHGYGSRPDDVGLFSAGRGDFSLPLTDLSHARASLRAMKHRAATVSGPADGYNVAPALRSAFAATVANMMSPEMRNFGLPGIAKWADELSDTRTKQGWTAIFGSGHSRDAIDAIRRAAVVAAAQRRLYAAFLREASSVVNSLDPIAAATGYDTAAAAWDALAEAAAPPAELAVLATHVHEIEAAERAAIRPLADWSA